jgi:hypothetical protein
MKKIYLPIVTAIIFIYSCAKEPSVNATFNLVDETADVARVKFINAYPFATPLLPGQTSAAVQLNFNDFQFSNIAAPIAIGGTFPAAPNYSVVQPGVAASIFGVRLSTGAPPGGRDSALFNFGAVLSSGKYYSLFFCDSINKPGTVLTVADDIKLPADTGLIRVRFVNLIPNAPSATPRVDVYSTRLNSVILSNVAYKGVTQFIELPRLTTATSVTETYAIRWSGTTTNVATVAVALTNGISITLFSRGLVGTTGARAPGLSFYRNL